MKMLPREPSKTKQEVNVTDPKVKSTQNLTKVIFLGVVLPSDSYEDFNGEVIVERVI